MISFMIRWLDSNDIQEWWSWWSELRVNHNIFYGWERMLKVKVIENVLRQKRQVTNEESVLRSPYASLPVVKCCCISLTWFASLIHISWSSLINYDNFYSLFFSESNTFLLIKHLFPCGLLLTSPSILIIISPHLTIFFCTSYLFKLHFPSLISSQCLSHLHFDNVRLSRFQNTRV